MRENMREKVEEDSNSSILAHNKMVRNLEYVFTSEKYFCHSIHFLAYLCPKYLCPLLK
jgi:hypothetical protein